MNERMSVFLELVRELPLDTILCYDCSGNSVNVAQMATELEQGSQVGLSYVEDCLRVARDFLKRKAKKDSTLLAEETEGNY